jgi:protein gp37
MAMWNLWHGCRKLSPGCLNCYVYRTDEKYGRNSADVRKTRDFDLPLRASRSGGRLPPGETVYTCFTSDFLLEDADPWRGEAWRMMRLRPDLNFLFITKRIHRLGACLPPDWGEGYENVQSTALWKIRTARTTACRCFCPSPSAIRALCANRCWNGLTFPLTLSPL